MQLDLGEVRLAPSTTKNRGGTSFVASLRSVTQSRKLSIPASAGQAASSGIHFAWRIDCILQSQLHRQSRASMSATRLLGIILMVVGVILLYFGLRATDSVSESVTEGLTGKYTDETTWFIVGGAVAVVAGGVLAFFSRGGRVVAA